MSRILVLYHSRSGHTEKMAKLVAEGAEKAGAQVTLKKVQDAAPEDMIEFDGIIIGSPTYYGTMAGEIKTFIDESVRVHTKLTGRVAAAFSSSANIGGGNETTIVDILKSLLVHGMVIQGDPKGDHYGPVSIGSPDKRSSDECERLGKRTAELAEKLK